MKTALVCGGHGFIGHHMARRLKREGYWVRTVDIKEFPYGNLKSDVDDYVVADLRDFSICKEYYKVPTGGGFDEIYMYASWMGGAQVVFSGEYDYQIMHDAGLLDINCSEMARRIGVGKLFFASSACCYNQKNQLDTNNPVTSEDSAYPADPDSDYGFTKLFSERIYQALSRNFKTDVRIGRFHNIFGTEGAWGNKREKCPAAMCRRVAEVKNGETIEMFGDGEQTRSFLYISECLEAVRRLMDSDYKKPTNIGSDEMISINNLVEMVKKVAGKPNIKIKHVDGPLGVRGRNSDNNLIKKALNWAPDYLLIKGIEKTYPWIKKQVESGVEDCSWSN